MNAKIISILKHTEGQYNPNNQTTKTVLENAVLGWGHIVFI